MNAKWWHELPSRDFMSQTNPTLVLRERRAPVMVNRGSSLTGRRQMVAYAALNDDQRALFDAQLAAWRAGCALVAAADIAAHGIGVSVPGETVSAWESARDEYEMQRQCARERKAVERFTQRH